MKLKTTFLIPTISLLALTLFFASGANASEVVGSLNSAGVNSSISGGSEVAGTFGGGTSGGSGSEVTGTVTGGSTGGGSSVGGSVSGGGSTGRSGSFGGSVINGVSSPLAIANFSDGFVPANTLFNQSNSFDTSNGGSLAQVGEEDLTSSSTDDTFQIDAQTLDNQNASQLAAIGTFGSGAWFWWLLLLLALVLVSYYIYRRYKDRDGRYTR